MEYLKYHIFMLSSLVSAVVAMDVFSSMVALRRMKSNQENMIETVEKYIQSEYDRLTDIRKSLDYIKLNIQLGHKEEPGYMDDVVHPIAAYALVRDWASIASKAMYRDKHYEEAFQTQFPDDTDHIGSVRSLLRLQKVYNLSTAAMAQSNIWGHTSHSMLQNNDFFDLGVEAMAKTMYETAIEWMDLAVQNPPTHTTTAELYHRVAEAYYSDAQYEEAVAYSMKAREHAPGNTTIQAKSELYIQTRGSHKVEPIPRPYLPKSSSLMLSDYEKMCRKETLEGGPQWYHANVSCEYREGVLPYVRYKLEILCPDPFVSMFYDVISDKEANMITESAKPGLYRAKVGMDTGHISEIRISQLAWLYDIGDANILRISKRIQDATGLSTNIASHHSDAEPFQVVNYGIGGQYEPHTDAFVENPNAEVKFLRGSGRRVATFIFYLTNIIEGGATVFPLAKIYVPAVKNAAAFWYNLDRTGEIDARTTHAGCPVLVGEKWIANKWIREGGQIWRRPCGIHANTTEPEARAVVNEQ